MSLTGKTALVTGGGRGIGRAGAVVHLASPAADYVTGQTLSVSGGLPMA